MIDAELRTKVRLEAYLSELQASIEDAQRANNHQDFDRVEASLAAMENWIQESREEIKALREAPE